MTHLSDDDLRRLIDGETLSEAAYTHLAACHECHSKFNGTFEQISSAAPKPSPEGLASFAKFEKLERLAAGGMGIVYRAWQTNPRRQVALKMIRPDQFATPLAIRRFFAEADALADAEHPNILPIYEAGEHQGQHYFTMKLVEGGSLAARLRGKPLPPREAARLLILIARAVHFAHQRGLLHRDLKPANILLDDNDVPYVTDFGLAKRLEDPDDAAKIAAGTSPLAADESRPGAILGSPPYMAPEQAAGERHTIATDVYGLGAILYETLTGRAPYRGDSPRKTIDLVKAARLRTPRDVDPNVPLDLDAVCAKCLAKAPADRYASADELARDLERFLGHEPVQARPLSGVGRAIRWVRRKPALAALYGMLIVAVLGGLALSLYYNAALTSALADEASARQQADANLRLAVAEAAAKEVERAKAVQERDRAEEALAKAVAGVEYWLKISDTLVRHSVTKEIKEVRHRMLLEGVRYFEDLLRLRPEDRPIERELANVFNRLGFFHRGWPEEQSLAIGHFEKALAILEQPRHVLDEESQKSLAKANNNLAGIYRDQYLAGRKTEDYERAVMHLQQSIAVWRRQEEKQQPPSLSTIANLTLSMNNLVSLMIDAGKDTAADWSNRALDIAARGNALYPKNILMNSAFAHAHANLGNLHDRQGNLEKAIEHLATSLEISRVLLLEEPNSESRHSAVALGHYNVALLSWKNYLARSAPKDLRNAEQHAREAKLKYDYLLKSVGAKAAYQTLAKKSAELLERIHARKVDPDKQLTFPGILDDIRVEVPRLRE